MAFTGNVSRDVYQGAWVREDVLDIIYQITPEDTPMFNMIGDSVATNPDHAWPIRSLSVRTYNANIEGSSDFTIGDFDDLVVPTREHNFTQIFRKLPRVTGTGQAVNAVAISDLMADQIQLRSVEFKTDIEHALLRGTLVTGPATVGSATARALGGFHNYVTTNSSDHGSKTTLTEALFNDMLQAVWTAGGRAQDCLAHGDMKRRISTFVGGSTKFLQAEGKRVYNTIGVYESDFHTTLVHLSRDVLSPLSGGLPSESAYYLFDRSFFAKAWLRKPRVERLAKVGDDERAMILAEVTLELGNEAAGAVEHGLW
jgi:hypothetical protein